MKQTNPQSPQPAERPPDESIKETFESIVIAFILAFVFRAYIVEAFVIPTGSMAPTLLGAHYNVNCQQCGYAFTLNSPGRSHGDATCPMCRYNNPMPRVLRALPGDRILVHKYIFSISEPKRWDVVVFKAPHDPNTNFIKRLVGLPNETLHLLDGNLYTQAQGQNTWKIARKGDRPKVQRAVWQPIYHSQYIPRDRGGLMGPGERGPSYRWATPWVAQSGQWDLDGRRGYRFHGQQADKNQNTPEPGQTSKQPPGQTPGRITFDFRRGGHLYLPGVYPYNQFDISSYPDDIEDIRLALAVQPQTDDCSISLSTQTRLNGDGSTQTVTARIDADGTIHLTATDPHTGQTQELATAQAAPLTPERSTAIEFWALDHELSVWINGKRALRYLFASELTFDELVSRPAPQKFPQVAIELTGGPATLHRVELDRDLYYASNNPSYARGGLVRLANDKIDLINARPMQLHDDEFFCIGDNSPLSDDGRFWAPSQHKSQSYPHAMWIRQRDFNRGLADASRDGIVPGRLMMGRAFFVYFPAPFPWAKNGSGIIPNFADMRFIH